jgi:hypothetical protein
LSVNIIYYEDAQMKGPYHTYDRVPEIDAEFWWVNLTGICRWDSETGSVE